MGVVKCIGDVWLVGVVVRRYIDILIIITTSPYSTCISSFFGTSIPISLFIFKMFFRSCIYIYIHIYIVIGIITPHRVFPGLWLRLQASSRESVSEIAAV